MDGIEFVIALLAGLLVVGFLEDYLAKRSCLKKLKEVGAVSPESAVTAEEAGILPKDKGEIGFRRLFHRALKALVKQGKIEVADGRYYIQNEQKGREENNSS